MDKVLVYVILVVALVAIGPLLTIWALNTLFPVLAIPYAFDTWSAVVLMGMFFRANVTVNK
jgi:hypothetical protein